MRAGIVSGCGSGVGFYGKLPSHGDFVQRRVSDAFVRAWDEWLQAGIAASRRALGERWLEIYLTSPAWRFACSAGACGAAPILGLMLPSVDRVGRYFPLTLAAELPHTVSPIAAATCAESFFAAAEQIVIQTLAADQVDFDGFDEQVHDLSYELSRVVGGPRLVLEQAAAAILDDGSCPGWQIPVSAPSELGSTFEQLFFHRLSTLYDPLVLWWTEGSSIVDPTCLIGKGLPPPGGFAALIDGSWREGHWRSVAAHVETESAAETLVEDGRSPRFQSVAATHAGRVRADNEDAFLERSEVGVWVVADGLGGHARGDLASRMVCDAVTDVVPGGGFDDAIEAVRRRIGDVNEHLVRAARRSPDAATSGSTVVSLLARGSRCAILWAGDSRVYRWRSGSLEQLTRDHSLGGAGRAWTGDQHAVTRAVGGETNLTLALRLDRVRVGDRFLLCSDGLTRVVSDPDVCTWMAHEDATSAVNGLIDAALNAGAPDNVTVLIVEACPSP